MATKVLLTIDTELVWRHHVAGLSWEENFARTFEAAGVGIPYQLRVLAEHGLKACFFVDPMPAAAHGLEPVRRMIEPILAAGQEVQLHVHPFWARLAQAERQGKCPELTSFDADEQRALIEQARDLLVAAGAPPPIAFRAGSFAADEATLDAVRALGLRYDSSHNGCQQPWPSALPIAAATIAPVGARGVVEIPVTQMEEQPGRLRHLQICAVSFPELRAALMHARRELHPLVTILSHSFELATRNGLRVNRVVQGRFLQLCRFLADNSDTLPTAWFSQLEGLPLGMPARPMPGRTGRKLRRMAGQFWADARYERPSEPLTIATGSSILGAEAVLPYVG
jgi:peptidoglycan/xylan/chitin deacetylase (PgdA/CDA1 family)